MFTRHNDTFNPCFLKQKNILKHHNETFNSNGTKGLKDYMQHTTYYHNKEKEIHGSKGQNQTCKHKQVKSVLKAKLLLKYSLHFYYISETMKNILNISFHLIQRMSKSSS